MNILLINPIKEESSHPEILFPLGLGYIARTLMVAGHSIDVLDINANRWTPEEVEDRIRELSFDAAGITSMITDYKQVKWLCSIIKKYHGDRPVIIGGGLPSVVPELVLRETEADIVVIGEGEATITELIDVLGTSGDLSAVKGIWYRRSGIIHSNPPRELLPSLDDIPFPAWELFPMDIYTSGLALGFEAPIKNLNMISSRGCSYRCIYCDHSIFGYRFRSRSVDNMIEEMKLLKERYGIKAVAFVDDLLILNKKRVYEFCKQMTGNDMNMMWSCNGRVNLIDENLLREMKSAGCVLMGYGIESGSQSILTEMNKKTTVDQAKRAIDMTWRSGITPFPYMMIGMPGETEETINETVEFCKEIGIVEGFGYAAPIPGTPLYDKAWESGKISSLKDLVEKWKAWQKAPIVNMTGLAPEKLIALKENAEKSIVNHIIGNHKKLIFKRMLYYYRIHGAVGLMVKLRIWAAKLVRRNFCRSSESRS